MMRGERRHAMIMMSLDALSVLDARFKLRPVSRVLMAIKWLSNRRSKLARKIGEVCIHV
jgi:hypothetical protein